MNHSNKLLSDIVAFRTYAKHLPHLGRREALEETINRCMSMHLDKFPKLSRDIVKAFQKVHELKVLPSMRSLQFSGDAVLKNNLRQYNCSALPVDDVRAFGEILFLLLSGCGVGFSVQEAHIGKLPTVRNPREEGVFYAHDSIMGWAQCVDALFEAYMLGRIRPAFNFSQIRPKGSYLVTTGAKAPGPEPLRYMLELVESKLKLAIGRRLKPIEVHDIVCIISDSVLAGGIRRCLPGDALVHTKDGLVPIKDTQVGQYVQTVNGFQPIKAKLNQGVQNVVKIITQNGTLECTANHRVAVVSSVEGAYRWVEAGKLMPGDRLYFTNEAVPGSITQMPDNNFVASKQAHTLGRMVVPELDTGTAWLLGLIHGDGDIYLKEDKGVGKRHGHVTVACAETRPEITTKAVKQLERFGLPVRVKQGGGKYTKVLCHSVELATYLLQFKKPKQSIQVPDFIKRGSIDIRGAYVAGLMDADRSDSSRPIIVASSVYPSFLQEVQNLLSSLGIASRFRQVRPAREKWQPLFRLSVCNKNQLEKLKRLVCVYGHKTDFIIPQGAQQYSYSLPSTIVNKSGALYRHKGASVSIEHIEQTIGKQKYTPVKVLSVEPGRTVETWDIEVEAEEHFFTNGYLVHNSALISLFDKDDKHMLTCKTGDWWNSAPWRARANNSAVLHRSSCTKEDFDAVFSACMNSGAGEPGVFFTNDFNGLTNPCFSGETLLHTEFGQVPIASLEGTSFLAKNVNGLFVPATVWSNGIKDTITLIFSSGDMIRCTPDHRFMAVDGTEVKAIDSYRMRIMPSFTIRSTNDEFVKYGYIQGDGGLGRLASTTYLGLEICIDKKDEDVAKLFDIAYTPGKHSYYTRGFNEQLLALDFDSSDLTERGFPGTFDNWSLPDKKSFLRGMYSANGSVIRGAGVAYKTASKKLADKLKDTLRSFGIHCYITTNKPTKVKFNNGEYLYASSYDVNITRLQSVLRFASDIGFVHSYKCQSLRELILSKAPLVESIVKSEPTEVFDFSLDDDTHWGVVGSGLIAHNCCEIALNPNQLCNLTTINQSNLTSEKDFLNRVYSAVLLGTLQAAYTDFPYVRDIWRQTTEAEALLGVSFTGIADGSTLVTKDLLRKASELAVEVNAKYAKKLGINPAARIGTVKPEGSSSTVLGSSSGIHARHAEHYIRRVRMNKDDALAVYLSSIIPELVEDDVFSSTGVVISIPQESPPGALLRDNETAEALFKRALFYRKNWIEPSHQSGANKHNVSVTISVKPEEWEQMRELMWKHRDSYSGISLLPYDGGTYQQAPFETCTKEKYEDMMKQIKEIDLKMVKEETDNTVRTELVACSGGLCTIE